jgi:hypothetical protein
MAVEPVKKLSEDFMPNLNQHGAGIVSASLIECFIVRDIAIGNCQFQRPSKRSVQTVRFWLGLESLATMVWHRGNSCSPNSNVMIVLPFSAC